MHTYYVRLPYITLKLQNIKMTKHCLQLNKNTFTRLYKIRISYTPLVHIQKYQKQILHSIFLIFFITEFENVWLSLKYMLKFSYNKFYKIKSEQAF